MKGQLLFGMKNFVARMTAEVIEGGSGRRFLCGTINVGQTREQNPTAATEMAMGKMLLTKVGDRNRFKENNKFDIKINSVNPSAGKNITNPAGGDSHVISSVDMFEKGA